MVQQRKSPASSYIICCLSSCRKGYKNTKIWLFWGEAHARSALTAPEPSHIHSVTFTLEFWGNTNIKELVTFLYFVFLDSIVHLPFFFNDPLAVSNQLPGRQSTVTTQHVQSEKAEDVFDVIRRRAGVSLYPAECLHPRKIPHLSPQEINIGPSASLFSCDEKTRSGTEQPTEAGWKV